MRRIDVWRHRAYRRERGDVLPVFSCLQHRFWQLQLRSQVQSQLPPDATSGPNPVSISSNYIVDDDRVPGRVILNTPTGVAAAREQGLTRSAEPQLSR